MTNTVTPITNKEECLSIFNSLRDQWAQDAEVYKHKQVNFRGGGHYGNVYWRPEELVWGLFEVLESESKYWIAWGVENPDGNINITLETNPPLEGFSRRCSAAFLRDDKGRVVLGHSGRVGGGRRGIGKKAFLRYTDLNSRMLVQWPDGKYTEYLRIGEIGGADLKTGVATFVHEVARFKAWAVES